MSEVLNDPEREPINRDAANILRPISGPPLKTEWTKEDEDESKWDGLISKCPSCGDRAYEHGHCFGCGRSLESGAGLAKKERKKKQKQDEDFLAEDSDSG